MGHRYGGTADVSYRYLVRLINQNNRLSQKKRSELLKEVDLLVGHIIADFDSHLRDQYGTYYICGSKFLKSRHLFSNSSDMLMEVALKALESCSRALKRFKKAGYVERI